jgi:hypothetical protein
MKTPEGLLEKTRFGIQNLVLSTKPMMFCSSEPFFRLTYFNRQSNLGGMKKD